MVWIPLKNSSGQVVKGIKLRSPHDSNVYEVAGSKRHSCNYYKLTLVTDGKEPIIKTNHEIRREEWTLEGNWFTPEEMAIKFNRKRIDPDANLPRPKRESFWRMKSKPGTFNYRQKKRLMADPFYQQKFGHLFATTIVG